MPEAAFEQVEIRESGRHLDVRCCLRNTGDHALRREEGTAAGWQLFDPETGLFIQEGTWKAIPDLKPGGTYDLHLPVELPVQPGRYRLFVSLRQQEWGWFYEHNQPFLLIEAEVAEGVVHRRRSLVTTTSRLRWEALPRLIQRALTLPFLTSWRNRALIASLVRRDILSRYRGSLGGRVWTFLSPLLLMTTYYFVFGVVLQTRFGADPSRSGFVLYFLAAMLPWLAFSESLARAPMTLVENRNLIKKLVFPVEILPVNITLASLATSAFTLTVFLAMLILTRGGIPATALWLPMLLIPQILLTVGLCWFLAALGPYVRDLGHIMGFLLTLWFFLTPICYPEASLPPAALAILNKNPMYVLVSGYRAIFLEGQAPAAIPTAKLWLLSIGAAVAGHAWFFRLRRTFADVL